MEATMLLNERALVFFGRILDRMGIHPDTMGRLFYFLFNRSLRRKYLISQTDEHWIFQFDCRTLALRKHDMADLIVFWQIIEERIYDFPLALTRSPKHIVDCGANIGISAAYFADKFADARVYGLEIDQGNLALMKKNAEPFGARIIPIGAGIYKTDGQLYFEKGDYNYSHKLAPHGAQKIDTISLATVMDRFEIDFVDILKIDIEGGEFDLTDSLDHCLPRVGCVMIEFEEPHKNKDKVDAFKEKLRDHKFVHSGTRMNVDCYFTNRS
jgi:FkbM family methyltransferase